MMDRLFDIAEAKRLESEMDDKERKLTESELRQARLMNIPKRGFCVSADLEKINADVHRHFYDPEEFAPPDICKRSRQSKEMDRCGDCLDEIARRSRVHATKGKYASVLTSSELFAEHKQDEIKRER